MRIDPATSTWGPGLAAPWGFLLLLCGLGLAAGCDTLFPPDPPLDNEAPLTDLANVPAALDTLFALETLHWDGGDDDGFVTSYEWRYTTYHPGSGSVACQLSDTAATDTTLEGWQQARQTDWAPTKATSLTIPFDSKEETNLQVFEVRSVDNQGAVDPAPARKCFYTEKTVVPDVYLTAPTDGEIYLARPEPTDWWQGITVEFYALDPDTSAGGGIVEVGWAVDGEDWQWTEDFERAGDTARHTVYIPPETFGNVTIRVNARDNTNLIGEPATTTVELIEYAPERDILIVDETHVGSDFRPMCGDGSRCGGFTEESVDEFYSDIFGVSSEHDVWDYVEEGGPPSKELLKQYRMVVWHADNPFARAGDYHRLADHTDLLADYMNVGGDLLMSGWQILYSFRHTANWNDPQRFEPGTFVHDYLHIALVGQSPRALFDPGDFGGARGVTEHFSGVRIDSSKAPSPYDGGLDQVNVVLDEAAFTRAIYAYDSRLLLSDEDIQQFNGKTVGHRYFGSKSGFDVVVFGFPLAFLKKEDACTLGREVLRSLGYSTGDVCPGG